MDVKKIGNNILYYLKEKKMSQVDLANSLGTSKQMIYKITKGKKAMKIDELIKIAECLDKNLEDLINPNHDIEDKGLNIVHLSGHIKDKKTAEFIINLIDNLDSMDEELSIHGLLR